MVVVARCCMVQTELILTISYRSPRAINVRWQAFPCCSTHQFWLSGHSGWSTASSHWDEASCCRLMRSSFESSFSDPDEFLDTTGPPISGSKLCRQAMEDTWLWVIRPQTKSTFALSLGDHESPIYNALLVSLSYSLTLEVTHLKLASGPLIHIWRTSSLLCHLLLWLVTNQTVHKQWTTLCLLKTMYRISNHCFG